jgi:multidrug efflux pump
LKNAVVSAARIRFRPIVMTSLAFSFGVLPLALANGAGSRAQNAVGTGVIGGMVASTSLGILLVPVFFVVILHLFRVRPTKLGAGGPVPAGAAADKAHD